MDVARRLAARVGSQLEDRGLRLVTAESCTGGGVAHVVTSVPGSSVWFDRGFVTYSDASKRELFGVSPETLDRHGAVSEEVVRQMADNVGVLHNGAGQEDALLLSARKLADLAVGQVLHAHLGQRGHGLCALLPAWPAQP